MRGYYALRGKCYTPTHYKKAGTLAGARASDRGLNAGLRQANSVVLMRLGLAFDSTAQVVSIAPYHLAQILSRHNKAKR
jgi:hypothetical protein